MAIGTALALGLSAGASLISGIANAASNMSAADRAKAIQDKNLQEWLKINIPDPKDQELALERFVQQGELDPKLEKAIKQDPSEFQKITTNNSYKDAQNRALAELEDIGYGGGLRLQDEAQLQEAMLRSNAQERASRDAITADMARRGIRGSGFELASKLAAQQSGADRNAQNSLSVAAQAQERALNAIMQAGDLGGKLRGQDFSEQAQKAAAADAINRFNTQNLQDVQQRNVNSQNLAQAQNLQSKQNIANMNTQLSNQQQQYNKGLAQQQFENQMKLTAGKTNQYGNMANLEQQKGQMAGNLATNIGSGIGGAITSEANYERQKALQDQQMKLRGY